MARFFRPGLESIQNLSVNSVDGQLHLAERHDRGGDVVESNEASLKLLVSHEQLSEAIETTMANLGHATTRLLDCIAPLGSLASLPAPTGNVSDVAVRFGGRVRGSIRLRAIAKKSGPPGCPGGP